MFSQRPLLGRGTRELYDVCDVNSTLLTGPRADATMRQCDIETAYKWTAERRRNIRTTSRLFPCKGSAARLPYLLVSAVEKHTSPSHNDEGFHRLSQ